MPFMSVSVVFVRDRKSHHPFTEKNEEKKVKN